MILAEDVIPAVKRERLLDAIETVLDDALYEIEDVVSQYGRTSSWSVSCRAKILADHKMRLLEAVMETEVLVVAK